MARLTQGCSSSVAIISIFMLLLGAGAAIAGWIFENKTHIKWSTSVDGNKVFFSYWWGGAGFVCIGSFGIAAGCTRNVCMMILYLIFNIVGMIAVTAVSVLVAIALLVWTIINEANETGHCVTIPNLVIIDKKCLCNYEGQTYTIFENDCAVVPTVYALLLTILATCAASGFLSFIASYISCCALCHQETPPPVIITQPGGAYAPPPMVVAHATYTTAPGVGNLQQFGAPPMHPYPSHPPAYSPEPQVNIHDQAQLMKNQVI